MLALQRNEISGEFDLVYDEDGQLVQSGYDLETAIIVSLFTDKAKTLLDSAEDRRGFWADAYSGDTTGSLLWTYETSVASKATAGQISKECEAALKWMVDERVVRNVSATVTLENDNVNIYINVTLLSNDITQLGPFSLNV